MSALVVHAQGNKSLAIIRSLGRNGIPVVAADSSRSAPGFCSRYVKSHIITPSPELQPEEFIHAIEKRVKAGDIDALLPSNSVETLLITRYRNRFEPFTRVPFAPYETMLRLHNKESLSILASGLDLPIPRTFAPEHGEDIRTIARNVSYPVVIKPKESSSSRGVVYAKTPEELLDVFTHYRETYAGCNTGYPLVQEYIPGDGYGVSVLFNQGELRALFTHRRLREYPLTGGPSTLRESVHHAEMEQIAVSLLKAVKWHGVAMVEFKLHRDTGKPYIIEVNPRFWGSVSHAIASGVDFPTLLYTMAVEGDVSPVVDYRIGVRTRFLLNDLRALYSIYKENKDLRFFSRELFAGYPTDELCRDDPLPFFMYLKNEIVKSFIKGE